MTFARTLLVAGLALAAVAAAAQEPADLPPADAPSGELPPADRPADAVPPPAEPAPLPAVPAVPPETLRRLALTADELWRVAVLGDGRFAGRVALTQADLGRRLGRLIRAQGGDPPGGPPPDVRQRLETLRAQPPEAVPTLLAAGVRQDYPDLIATLEGWAAGPEQAAAAALLPALRAELDLAAGMPPPALTGAGTSAPPASSDGGDRK